MVPAASCVWLLLIHVLVATDDSESFRSGERKRLVQKKAQNPQDADMVHESATIQQGDERLHISEKMLAKAYSRTRDSIDTAPPAATFQRMPSTSAHIGPLTTIPWWSLRTN
jgi:hypothetical protein